MGLVNYVKPYRVQFTLGSVAKLIEAMLELYLPFLMAQILDSGIPVGDKSFIIKIALQMLFFAVLGFGFACICQYFASATSQKTGTLIRDEVMKKIAGFSYADLDKFGTSALINRLTTDINNYQLAIAMTMRLLTRAPFICIGAVIMSLIIDWKLALIFIALIPVISLILYFFMKYSSKLYNVAQQKLDKFALIVRENLSGIRVIRAFATTKQEAKRAKDTADEVKDSNIRVGLIFAWMEPITSIVLNLGIVAVVLLGATRVFEGVIGQGDVLSLTIYATKILYALVVCANLVVIFSKAKTSSERIGEVLDTETSISFVEKSIKQADYQKPCLEVKNIDFAYPKSKTLIKDMSFDLKQGETLGIVGTTGSGKSTLLNLVQRLYDVSKGEIKLFGNNIKDYANQDLRDIIGTVPQNNILFSGTIADNIKMGKEDATDQEIIEALKTAQCWDFVSQLPENIDAIIFEGGKNFSGGQKQRLTIARALVKKPKLLLLDDSLSALDYQTDLNLRKALAKLDQDLATIIVSQRISSVINADKIIVLDNGLMQCCGNHEELLKDCRPYIEIYESQIDKDSDYNNRQEGRAKQKGGKPHEKN